MIRLYHCSDARSFRPLWTLEELGLPYQLEMLPFPPRQAAPEFLGNNPLGTIPLMVDGAVRMTESAAICQYLATCHGHGELAMTPGAPEYGRFLDGLHFGEATLTFPLTLVLRYERFEAEERQELQVAADYSRWFLSRLRAFGKSLGDRPYICGEQFTVADISVGYALLLATKLGLDRKFGDPILLYWARLQERAAFRRADVAQKHQAINQGVALTDFDPHRRVSANLVR